MATFQDTIGFINEELDYLNSKINEYKVMVETFPQDEYYQNKLGLCKSRKCHFTRCYESLNQLETV